MIRPCSLERSLTWIQQSKELQVTIDSDDTTMSFLVLTYEDLNNAICEKACSMEMIQDWLHDCGPSAEGTSVLKSHHDNKSPYSKGNSIDDEFNLGAEAMSLFDHSEISSRVLVTPPRLKNMYLGNSVASNSTTKTCSSISDVLTMCQEDAETILYNLGFAIEESCKIPDRFLSGPSKAAGIDFKLFIDCQMHRLKEEDLIY